jgi:hyperosmotically inducible protein
MRATVFAAAMTIGICAATPAAALDLNPLSLLKGAVEAAVEDRGAGDIAKDAEIKAKIVANVIDKMASDVIAIGADVYEQDVMLTGSVETAKQKNQAGRLARGIEEVKKVYNEILVQRDIDKKKGTVENFVDDTVIESKTNALLLDAEGVNVTIFRWRSVGGHVFLFGRALSAAEREKAAQVVRGIKGVSRVTSRVKVRPKS